jgi:peptidoglycan/xylan/chitin deacetylase (PgdA/CDA1 family)
MLEPIKDLIEFIFAALYASFLPFVQKGPPHVVIRYHSVNKTEVMGFRKQMEYLSKECSVVKPSKIKGGHTNGAKVLVAITFDDAFMNIMENAVPILKEYGLPAGIFVPAGNLGQPPRWEMPDNCLHKKETVMTQKQIAELDNDEFEIFSHTLSHPPLTRVEDSKLEAELVSSKHTLEKIVGREVSGISYPHGAYDDRVYKAVQKAGYKFGFTIEPTMVNSNTDSLKIGRFSVSPRDSLIKFKLKVSGAYQASGFLRALKHWLQGNR